jgi:[acyl-carrier-protein] S-malonyltransferase
MRVAVVFPGQGSQFVAMADPWLEHEDGRDTLARASEILGRDIADGCRDEQALGTTDFVQPAILACDIAGFRVLEAAGVPIVGTAGHSLGEFAALVAAGVLTLEDAVRIVVERGRAMQAAATERAGTMTALLGVGSDAAASLCDEAREDDVLLVANENSPQQVVISGSVPAIERAEALAAERRIRAVRLKVAGAFHSPLMDPAVEPLASALDDVPFASPRFPVASNVTGGLVRDAEQLRALAKRQVVSAVRWERCAGALAETGCDAFVETGPGDVLTKLAKRAVPGVRAVALGTPGTVSAFAAESG